MGTDLRRVGDLPHVGSVLILSSWLLKLIEPSTPIILKSGAETTGPGAIATVSFEMPQRQFQPPYRRKPTASGADIGDISAQIKLPDSCRTYQLGHWARPHRCRNEDVIGLHPLRGSIHPKREPLQTLDSAVHFRSGAHL